MPQKLTQTQTQTQVQTLTPQQMLQIKLLELPVNDLEQRINNELMDNEALEQANRSDREGDNFDNQSTEGETSSDENENNDDLADGDQSENNSYEDSTNDAIADYANDDETPDYLLQRANEQREQREIPFGESTSFYEHLLEQISEHELSPHEVEVIKYLIGSLDEDGLLRKDLATLADELTIYHNIESDEHELKRMLQVLQTFEPIGIGAQSLQECLHLQIVSPDFRSPLKKAALQVIDKYFDDFTHKRWEKLQQRLGLTSAETERLRSDLLHLNPRPGNTLGDSIADTAQTIIPDFIVENDGVGNLRVRQNNGEIPVLCISRSFRDTLNELSSHKNSLSREQKATYAYTKQKVEAAEGFIKAIRQRHHTMQSTMEAIVELQRPFFEEGGDDTLLRPMILKDVATHTGLDISTISRVSNSKYVETEFGVFPLKYFFNDKFTLADGTEHSTLKIRTILRGLIDGEDKNHPLADEALADLLKKEGYPVARRTVAKYREQMGIPVARLRK